MLKTGKSFQLFAESKAVTFTSGEPSVLNFFFGLSSAYSCGGCGSVAGENASEKMGVPWVGIITEAEFSSVCEE